jgi:hypothetical protein
MNKFGSEGTDLGDKDGAGIMVMLTYGNWESWWASMMGRLLPIPEFSRMMMLGVQPDFDPIPISIQALDEHGVGRVDSDGDPVMATPPKWRGKMGEMTYRDYVKRLGDREEAFNRSRGNVVRIFFAAHSVDMLDKVKSALPEDGFMNLMLGGTNEELIDLYRTSKRISTGAGGNSVHDAFTDLHELKCERGGFAKYVNSFLEKKRAIVALIGPRLTWEQMVAKYFDTQFLLSIAGKEPMFNEFVDKEMCKPEWREYGILIPELTTLLTSMSRVKRIAAADGSLAANQATVAAATDTTQPVDLHAMAGHIVRAPMKCFNCLGPHSYRNCKMAKAKCSTCGFAHHSDMHNVVQELNERAAKRSASRPGPSPAEIDAARAVGMKAPSKAYLTDVSGESWEATVAGYHEYVSYHSDNPADLENEHEDAGSYSAMMARMAALEVDQTEPVRFRASMAKFDRHQFEPSEWEL